MNDSDRFNFLVRFINCVNGGGKLTKAQENFRLSIMEMVEPTPDVLRKAIDAARDLRERYYDEPK